MRTGLWWRNVGKEPFGKIGVYVMISFKYMLKNKMLELGLDSPFGTEVLHLNFSTSCM